MLENIPIISYLLLFPLMGALFVILAGADKDNNMARGAAFLISLLTLAISILICFEFDINLSGYQFVEKATLLPFVFDSSYLVGVDGISLYLLPLTCFIIAITILSSWNLIKEGQSQFYALLLLLEAAILGVFVSMDGLLFYIFFEASLIPLYIIVGRWGGEKRVHASIKFFLYSIAGSLLFLIGLIFLMNKASSTNLVNLVQTARGLGSLEQKWLWFAFFAGFAVKIPLWPLHTWLPDLHKEAPIPASVVLAGIMHEVGAYGFIRFSLTMLPEASQEFARLIYILSSVGLIYFSFVAYGQRDLKKFFAYATIAHMALITAGIFSLALEGVQGALYLMITHSIIAAGLFVVVGVLYERTGSTEISFYSGTVESMPKLGVIFMILMLATVGLPGTSSFVGEFFTLIGVYEANKLYMVLLATGIILTPMYMLRLYWRVMYREINSSVIATASDVNKREMVIFVPLIVISIIFGIYTTVITKVSAPEIKHILSIYNNK